ncbi:eCIS core domain-containing protein [Cupriavidus oxalaticus]|jgi:hypothetical protein|uniref:eCIS core domain-containing protein n=1 Tax=Cupriavidus oxalaticus TaxID=96344 RepID=UPI0040339FFD
MSQAGKPPGRAAATRRNQRPGDARHVAAPGKPHDAAAPADPARLDNQTHQDQASLGLLRRGRDVGGEVGSYVGSHVPAPQASTACSCTPGQPPCPACLAGGNAILRRKPRSHDLLRDSPGLALGHARPLGDSERGFFERRYHADLSAVRVHDNSSAAASATRLNARAFSTGADIAFGAGEFRPHTREGRHLLAHELAHVVQGHGGIRRAPAADAPAADAPATDAPATDAPATDRAAASADVRLSPTKPWLAMAPAQAGADAVATALYGANPQAMPKKMPEWASLYLGKLVGIQEFEVQPELLVEPFKTQFYERMSARLEADVAAVESILLQARIDAADERRLIDYVDWWSRRKDLRAGNGRTYFDMFLGRLRQDTWHTDYLVADSASKPFLDKLYTEVEERVGELNSMIASNSREYGAYRPTWARLEDLASVAQGGTAMPEVNPELVTRTSDLIAERLAGVTTAEDSKVIGDLIGGMPPAAQAEVLRNLMHRFGEADWTGIFGRFGEAWEGGMLYFLFEDMTEADRQRTAQALRQSKVLPGGTVDALTGGRGWGGKYLPYTTRLGHEAAEFYADECVHGEGAGSGAACVGLGFAVLWTPETAGATVATLATAGLGGPVAQAFPTLGRVMLVGGTGVAAYQGTQALVELATGTGMDGKPLDSTDKLTRGILLVSSALFMAAGFMGAASLGGKPPGALAPRPPGTIEPAVPGGGAGGGAAAEGAIPLRMLPVDPVTGECTVLGQNPATGEVAVLRINMKTGDGVMQSGATVRAVSRWQLQPKRPLLGPAASPSAGTAPASAPASAPGTPAALAPRYLTVAELLPNPAEPFAVPAVETAYQGYVAGAPAPKPRLAWILATRGGPRATLVDLLGPNFPGPAESAASGANIQLGRIARPATLTQAALDKHLATVQAQPGKLGRKVAGMQRGGAGGDEVGLGLFNNLKGNIGEILSESIQAEVLATVRTSHPGARSYADLHMQLPGGKPVEFSDNLIATEADGNLYVRAGFEVKSGGAGGQEATEQIHSWIEGRLADGAELILADGRRFMYAPDRTTGPGRVIFLASAPRHIIAPLGAEQLGTGSGMGVAGPVQRHALPVTPQELNYIARLIAEGMPAAPP